MNGLNGVDLTSFVHLDTEFFINPGENHCYLLQENVSARMTTLKAYSWYWERKTGQNIVDVSFSMFPNGILVRVAEASLKSYWNASGPWFTLTSCCVYYMTLKKAKCFIPTMYLGQGSIQQNGFADVPLQLIAAF